MKLIWIFARILIIYNFLKGCSSCSSTASSTPTTTCTSCRCSSSKCCCCSSCCRWCPKYDATNGRHCWWSCNWFSCCKYFFFVFDMFIRKMLLMFTVITNWRFAKLIILCFMYCRNRVSFLLSVILCKFISLSFLD